MTRARKTSSFSMALTGLVGFGLPATVAQAQSAPVEFSALSFEQLAQIKVVTVSNRPEAAWRAPSSVFVLTGEDAIRTGAVNIPEALRVVPGLNVSQINGSTWGIGARGFQGQFSAKLLVMIDGRSVYSPVFGGVFWDTQDYSLADLDRIEVVLGPGGSVWGANAVSGVINILTRPAQDTLGDRVMLAGGDGGGMIELRHGWRLDERTAGRVYAKFVSAEATRLPAGGSTQDATHMARGGFRVDHESRAGGNWTFSGEAYQGTNDFTAMLPTLLAPPTYQLLSTTSEEVQGGDLLGRWNIPFGAEGMLRFGASVDTDARHGAIFNFNSSNAQADLQHSLTLGSRHAIDWGTSVRTTAIDLRDRWIAFSRHRYRFSLWSGFVQDKVTLLPDQLELTGGLKVEKNDFTGFEPQPSVKLAWFPNAKHTLWAGWARSVRTPALTEDSTITDAAVFPPGVLSPTLPVAIRGLGNPALDAETLAALDAGWRWAPTPQWSVSASVFLNEYDHLIKVTGAAPFIRSAPVAALIRPLPEDNGLQARVAGGELAVTWQPASIWRLNLGVSQKHVTATTSTSDPFNFAASVSGNVPRWTVTASSTVQFATDWELSADLRWVDEMVNATIPSYSEATVYLAWRPRPGWELDLVGRNLFDAQHPEGFPNLAGPRTEIPRRVELRVTWTR